MDIKITNTSNAKLDASFILSSADSFESLANTMRIINTSIQNNWADCPAKTSAINGLNSSINYYETKIVPALNKLGSSIDAYALATEQLASANVNGGVVSGVSNFDAGVPSTPSQYADSVRTVNFSQERYDELGGGTALYDGSYSKEEFVEMLQNYGSTLGSHTMEGGYLPVNEAFETKILANADVFYDEATKYGLDPTFIVGIACQESGFGSSWNAVNKNNLFGMGAFDSNPSNAYKYDGASRSIAHVCQNIGENYIALDGKWYTGSNIKDIGRVYASGSGWADNVTWFSNKIKEHAN